MDKIVVIGGGGHARVIISILKKLKNFEIAGYVDIKDKGVLLGVMYLGADPILSDLIKLQNVKTAVLAIGMLGQDKARESLRKKIESLGFSFPSIISPDACIGEDVSVGEGSVIMDGAVINVGSRIGKFCVINTNATVDHDCNIGNNVHIAPNSTLCGHVVVQNNSLIGAGTVIIQDKKIASETILGAGSVVIKDIVEAGIYAGNPVRLLKNKVRL